MPRPQPLTPTNARPRSPETYASLSVRNAAAEILQSYEQLSWYALERNEVRVTVAKKKQKTSPSSPSKPSTSPTPALQTSLRSSTLSLPDSLTLAKSLSQTRLHFLSLLSGFNAADAAAKVDWKLDHTPHGSNGLPTSVYSGMIPLGGEERRKGSVVAGGKGKERASLGGGEGRRSLGGEGSAGGSGSGSGSGRKKRRSEGGS
jgi:hypothetical protein